MYRKLLVPIACVVGALTLFPGVAHAATTTTSPIKAGSDGVTVGSATFTRSDDGDGTETLTITLSVPSGIAEDSVCLSDSPFTSRISPGSCAYRHENVHNATSDSFTIDLRSTYVGETLYAQLHVATSHGDTAYAGWNPEGSGAFYGNLALADPAGPGPTTVPVGTVGGIGVAAFAGLALYVAQRRRRPRVASSA